MNKIFNPCKKAWNWPKYKNYNIFHKIWMCLVYIMRDFYLRKSKWTLFLLQEFIILLGWYYNEFNNIEYFIIIFFIILIQFWVSYIDNELINNKIKHNYKRIAELHGHNEIIKVDKIIIKREEIK